jgi:hypothetical protein
MPTMKARILLALTLAAAFSARADVVDLSRGGRSVNEGVQSGFSARVEFGNEFSPYGQVGVAFSYLFSPGLAIEAGVGGGFPGAQAGLAVRQLFGTGTSNIAFELSFAGNTKVPKANPGTTPQTVSASRYIWTSLGGGYEQRIGRVTFSVIGAAAFTPADTNVHFGIHGGIGYYFF